MLVANLLCWFFCDVAQSCFPELQVGLKIGVKTRGCNGLTYTLDYCNDKGKFDEIVEQDGRSNSLTCPSGFLYFKF
jgi:hypothetical protein